MGIVEIKVKTVETNTKVRMEIIKMAIDKIIILEEITMEMVTRDKDTKGKTSIPITNPIKTNKGEWDKMDRIVKVTIMWTRMGKAPRTTEETLEVKLEMLQH